METMKNFWTVGDLHFARTHDRKIVCWSAGSTVHTETWSEVWNASKAAFDEALADLDRTGKFQYDGMFWDREVVTPIANESYWKMPVLTTRRGIRSRGDRTQKEQVTPKEYEEAHTRYLGAKREKLRAKYLAIFDEVPHNAIKVVVCTEAPNGDIYTRCFWAVPV